MSADEEMRTLSDAEQQKLDEFKAEVELGRNMAGRLLQFYGTVSDENLVNYVNTVGKRVAQFGDYPDRNYMFQILDTSSVNAFACPGGYILITLGSLKLVKSEAELAMILGHEVAHVGKQHMFSTLKKMSEKEREEQAKKIDDKAGFSGDPSLIVRKRPSQEKGTASGAILARYLSGSSGAGFNLLQVAKAGMNVILEKGLDKRMEFEADTEGVKYAIRAGYSPDAMIHFLSRLEDNKKSNQKNTLIIEKTHPKIADRKELISKLLLDMSAKDMIGAEGESRFKEKTKGLVK